MKKTILFFALFFSISSSSFAQKEKESSKKLNIPAAVRTALSNKYPEATKVTWENDKGNYEANWGGRSGEDHSVLFTPKGDFIEIVNAIPVSQLPQAILAYVKEHYKGAKISEAGKVTDAGGKITYKAEVSKKDLIFDESGNFVKSE
jgi:hypothetical protein